jgi:hypothetical protein
MGIEEQDDLLNEALASYTGREPWPGIEERVLRRVREPGLARRSGWALALLAAACVIVMTMIPHQETMEITVPAVVAPPPVSVKVEAPHVIGKPERFPTPSPLTREERTLLALADSTILAGSETAEITPIRIEEIVIPPIGE